MSHMKELTIVIVYYTHNEHNDNDYHLKSHNK